MQSAGHLPLGPACPGSVAAVDGNKVTVDFDKAGQKRVVDSLLDKA